MKYLIVGLGNIGEEYSETRHNIGFQILDSLAEAYDTSFKQKRLASICEIKYKSRIFVLIKPSTFVNRSGKAVNYWLKKTKVPIENLLIVLDDISLPFGTIRLKTKGGDAGHNGLIDISLNLGHENYPRLRFGIGNDFSYGAQVDHVLGEWTGEELKKIPERVEKVGEVIKSFGTIGIGRTMNVFNNT